MADFGDIFDKAKADTESKIQGYRENARRDQEEKDNKFQELMRPLNEIVRPAIEKAQNSLAARNVDVKIDHEEFYNTFNGKRVAAVHFQLFYAGHRSKVYTFQLDNSTFSCNADDGTKRPWGQRDGIFATDRSSVSTYFVEEALSRAINEIMQAIEQEEFRNIFPNSTSVAPA